MTVLRESPWYQEILQEGEARGEARGEAKGVERVARNLLQMQIPLDQISQATGLTLDQLQQLQQGS